MKFKSKKGLTKPFAITYLSLKKPCLFCSGKPTNLQRYTIHYLNVFILMLSKVAEKFFFYLPKISTLSCKIISIRCIRKKASPVIFKVPVGILLVSNTGYSSTISMVITSLSLNLGKNPLCLRFLAGKFSLAKSLKKGD